MRRQRRAVGAPPSAILVEPPDLDQVVAAAGREALLRGRGEPGEAQDARGVRPLDPVRAPPLRGGGGGGGGAARRSLLLIALLRGQDGDAPVGAGCRQGQAQLLRGERQGVDGRGVRRRLKGQALPRGRGSSAAAAALDPEKHSVVERGRGQEAAAEARVGPGNGPDGALVAGELGELRDGLAGDVEDLVGLGGEGGAKRCC